MGERIFRKICEINISVDPDDPEIDVEEAFRFAEEAVKQRMECCIVVIPGIKRPNACEVGYETSKQLKKSGRTDYKEITLKNGVITRVYPEEGLTINDITDIQLTQAKWIMESTLSVEKIGLPEKYCLTD